MKRYLPPTMRLILMCSITVALLAVVAGRSRSAERLALETADPAGTGESLIYLPVVQHLVDTSIVPIFGVQMYSSTTSNSAQYPFLVDSGATWVRIPVPWENVEPTNVPVSSFDWSTVDNRLGAARPDMGGFRFIGTIDTNPVWASGTAGGVIYADALDDFAEFVGAVVERYDGDGISDAPGSPVVDYWEFYNEPDRYNDPVNGTWGNNGAEYAQMLATVYPIVKSNNPRAQVVMGGMAYDWFEDQDGPFVREFLDDVLAAGGGNHIDVMNFHSYPAFASNWAPYGPGLLQKAAAIRSKLAEYGVSDKPMVVTEAGWHSDNPPGFPGSPEIQARYVVQLFTQSLAADLEAMIWWMLVDPGGGYYENGLVRVNEDGSLTAKPSFTVYQLMVSELSTARFERVLSQAETGAPDLEAYQFQDDIHGRKLYVTWLNPVSTNAVKSLRLPAAQATVRDIYFNTSTVTDGADGTVDGYVTIQVSGRPLYVEVNQ